MVYGLITLIIIGITLNELSKKYGLYNLFYKRELSKYAVEIGEKFEITTIVENKKILPVTFLQVIEKIPAVLEYRFEADVLHAGEHIYHSTTMYIMPKQRIKRTYEVSFNKRGRYTFEKVEVVVGDFLGTTTVRREEEHMQEMIVYPRTLDIEEELIPYGDYYGDISVQRWIISDPILTVGIREYTGNEPQKNIHWPSSMKGGSGRLMVKNFDYTTDNKIMIVLNIECFKPFWAKIDINKIEKSLSITRAVMEKFEKQGVPYGLVTNIQSSEFSNGKSYIPFGYGGAHFYNMLEFLGKANYSIGDNFEDMLLGLINNNENYTTYVIITPIILEEYIDAINSLSVNVIKTVLISGTEDNMERLHENIMAYTGVGREN